MKGLGVVTALAAESWPLGAVRERRRAFALLEDGTLLVVAGLGPAAAREGARRLITAGARALVSWGIAGGLDPLLVAGSIVLPREVISPERARFRTSEGWRQRVAAAIGARHPVCISPLRSCRQVVGSASEKAALFRSTAAAAVDMESAAVAEVAAAARLPFIAVRAVVDTAADNLPPGLATVIDESGALRVGGLLRSLMERPANLAVLMRLMHSYRAASRALATVARCEALACHASAPCERVRP